MTLNVNKFEEIDLSQYGSGPITVTIKGKKVEVTSSKGTSATIADFFLDQHSTMIKKINDSNNQVGGEGTQQYARSKGLPG